MTTTVTDSIRQFTVIIVMIETQNCSQHGLDTRLFL